MWPGNGCFNKSPGDSDTLKFENCSSSTTIISISSSLVCVCVLYVCECVCVDTQASSNCQSTRAVIVTLTNPQTSLAESPTYSCNESKLLQRFLASGSWESPRWALWVSECALGVPPHGASVRRLHWSILNLDRSVEPPIHGQDIHPPLLTFL